MSNVSKNLLISNQIALSNKVQAVMSEAQSLCAQREQFEKAELARSNKALYSILTNVYALFKKAVADKCIKETVTEMSKVLNKRGVRVQNNTPTLTVFVRFVFNSDRKRAYNYASTLMAAVQAEVEPTNLASFIEGKNGVEECKKEFKKKDETKKREEAIKNTSVDVGDLLKTISPISRVTIPNASVDFSDATDFAFIVARAVGNGEFELLRVVPKTTKGMQNTAIKEIAKDVIAKAEQAQAEAKIKKAKSTKEIAAKSITAKSAATMTVKELEAA
jgi:hypothetical protein